MVRVLVLRAAGINCDFETQHAFELFGARAERVHINRILEDKRALHQYHIIVIPGGFSYGDDLSAGRILGNQIRANLLGDIRAFVGEGKLVLGICNGFQVLVKSGLLPGLSETPVQQVTLGANDSNKYEDRWVHLKICSNKSEFIRGSGIIYLPVAHAEGKFMVDSEETLQRLKANDQIVLRYVDEQGRCAGYPVNPNGSTEDIAGVCDPTGRILGLMPHPERHLRPENHPRWTREGLKKRGDGCAFFENAVAYIRKTFDLPAAETASAARQT
jgi:phosphoribosylformylglycinamidine synthase